MTCSQVCDCDVCQSYYDKLERDKEAAERRLAEVRHETEQSIRVWRFEDAPADFKALSPHGGDEDWVAHIPASLASEYIGWMESGGPFGCASVSEHWRQDGSVVKIGAHA